MRRQENPRAGGGGLSALLVGPNCLSKVIQMSMVFFAAPEMLRVLWSQHNSSPQSQTHQTATHCNTLQHTPFVSLSKLSDGVLVDIGKVVGNNEVATQLKHILADAAELLRVAEHLGCAGGAGGKSKRSV